MIVTLFACICVTCLILMILYISCRRTLERLKASHESEIKSQRASAIKSSKSVIRGQVSEQLLPLFPDFPYATQCCRFMGLPIDYVVFNGSDAIEQGIEGAIVEVILAEVKTGTSQNSRLQRAIKKAVKAGRVRWESWTIGDDNKLKISE